MRAYKAFNPDWTCRGFQYEVGKEYKMDGSISICQRGFHACEKLPLCFRYYSFHPSTKIAEVELCGQIDRNEDKIVTNHIRIIREISWEEVLALCNSGNGNSGNGNSGDWNSGNSNSGNHNSGVRNTGNGNSGDRNSGDRNSGDRNSGDRNSGDRNSGDRNSGDRNSGSRNSGDRNSGSRNSGSWNSGSWNSGNHNSGNHNSGSRNSGDRNSGSRNSGSWNSGSWNSGSWNSGSWNSGSWNSGNHNSGNHNSGMFNTTTPDKIRVFNQWISIDEYSKIYLPIFLNFDMTVWVSIFDATEEEKKQYEDEITINGGFIKTMDYKEAFKESWDKADPKDRIRIKDIPGFDKDLFFEISGIMVED